MSSLQLLDVTGRRRSPAAMPGHNAGRAPRNEGMVYPADPSTVDEIVAVMRRIPADRHGIRLRALIVVLWRGGLRIQEALSLIESDLDQRRGAILVRAGKGNKRREVGMDSWAWSDHLAPWLACRAESGERERPDGRSRAVRRAARLLPHVAAAHDARSDVGGPAQRQECRCLRRCLPQRRGGAEAQHGADGPSTCS